MLDSQPAWKQGPLILFLKKNANSLKVNLHSSHWSNATRPFVVKKENFSRNFWTVGVTHEEIRWHCACTSFFVIKIFILKYSNDFSWQMWYVNKRLRQSGCLRPVNLHRGSHTLHYIKHASTISVHYLALSNTRQRFKPESKLTVCSAIIGCGTSRFATSKVQSRTTSPCWVLRTRKHADKTKTNKVCSNL